MAIASVPRSRWFLIGLAVAVALAVVGPRRATAQSAAAEVLFQAGKQLAAEGRLEEACAKFDASDRVEASVGTELNAADCHERVGQLATAWAMFLRAAGNAGRAGNDGDREAEARRRATALESRLAYLTISVPDSSRVDGLLIERNGEVVDPALWNTGVPVDPGEYEIVGQAPGRDPWSSHVSVAHEADKLSVEVPRFKPLADLVAQPDHGPGVVAPLPVPGTVVAAGRATPGTFTILRKVSIGAAAVGVGGIVAAVVFGRDARDLQRQADARCPGATCGDQHALDVNDSAQQAALKSNLGLGVGVVALGAGVALWFLGAPHRHGVVAAGDDHEGLSVAPIVGVDEAGLSFAGRF